MLFKSLLIAVSTHSIIPVPQFEWTEENMRYSICFLPVIGVFCGGGLLLWNLLAARLGFSALWFAVGALCLSLLITGGIHMDGYIDTVDALASHRSRERKLEILKDSNCGAFAVIYCGIYLLLNVGLFHELYLAGMAWAVCPMYLISRGMAVMTAIDLPSARRGGMLFAFTQHAGRRNANISAVIVLVLAAALALWLSPAVGGCMTAAAVLWVLAYRHIAMKQFGGVTGDTTGFFIQCCELACLLGGWIGVLIP